MRKLLLFLTLIFWFSSNSQTLGEINGYAVDLQFKQKIEDSRRQNNNLQQAYINRYKKFQDQYIYALKINALSENPKANPENGNYNAIITDGYKLMDKISVECKDGFIVSVTKDDQTKTINQSTAISSFRSLVKGKNGEIYEVIFTDIFN